MNIGILLCDHVQEKFRERHGSFPDMFSKLLLQVAPSLNFTIYDATVNQLPSHINDADAYLISGSRHGVNDGLPWISHLEKLILSLHVARKKIVGICFGHQLIAKALGGTVSRATTGWRVGISTNSVLKQKPWMLPAVEQFNLIVSHQDQVITLPKGAEVLAHNKFCPFYMLQLGHHILTVQGHPEYSKDYSRALMEERSLILGSEKLSQGMTSLELMLHPSAFAEWIITFLRY